MDHKKVIRKNKFLTGVSAFSTIGCAWIAYGAFGLGHIFACIYAVQQWGIVAGIVTFIFPPLTDLFWWGTMIAKNGWDNILTFLYGLGILCYAGMAGVAFLFNKYEERNQSAIQDAYDAEYD